MVASITGRGLVLQASVAERRDRAPACNGKERAMPPRISPSTIQLLSDLAESRHRMARSTDDVMELVAGARKTIARSRALMAEADELLARR
jgi:hypothetical protein